MASHDDKVARVASQLQQHRPGAALRIVKKTVPHSVPKNPLDRSGGSPIDTTPLDALLELDVEKQTCTAEPGLTFKQLVEHTLPRGLVPRCVPELKTITIGGAVAGCSIESASFRFGGFHDSCLEYEVLTSSGERLVCTPHNEHALVFQMMHGTFGTVGVLTKLKFRLMPARPFVHVRYERHGSMADYRRAIQRHFELQDVDFMDGLIHSPKLFVLCVGRFVEEAPYAHRYDWLRVYPKSTAERDEDYLRTTDYFFRYDHGVTNVHPKSFLGRLLFGPLMDSDRLLRLAQTFGWLLPRRSPAVTVDVFVPFSQFDPLFRWTQARLNHFPLWVVPYRRVRDYEWVSPRVYDAMRDALFVDLAIYGMRQPAGVNVYRLLEQELERLGGIKTLISHNYYSREEFWRTWNRETYERVKARTDPDNALQDLYDKTCRRAA
jgi:FAD/FMN-containing dehydrogenase